MASFDFDFDGPDRVIALPLDDDEAVAARARALLADYPVQVTDADVRFQEGVFRDVVGLARDGRADVFYVVIPEPPQLGVIAMIVMRFHIGEGEETIEYFLSPEADQNRVIIAPPEVSRRSTPMGTATRKRYRYTHAGLMGKKRFLRKPEAKVIEQLSWYWPLTDPDDRPVLINLTAFTYDLADTETTARIVDEFAESIAMK